MSEANFMLEFKKYENPQLFWNEVSPHLRKEESKNSLCLGLSYHFQTHPTECVYQCALFEGSELVGALVASKYRTQTILLPTPLKSPKYANDLFQDLRKLNPSIDGLVGELNTVKVYEKLLCESGKKTQVQMTQGIYRCTQATLPRNTTLLDFRAATDFDAPLISRWIEYFHQEATPDDPQADFSKIALQKIKERMIFIGTYEGVPVSMAASTRDIETSCSVNLVYTPKENRKKGYASIVTAMLTQQLLKSGKKETNLYTDMTNPTSNKIYQSIGYHFVCDSLHVKVSE